MHNWPQQLQALRATQSQAVLVTVAGIRGSAPREVGSNMIVTEAEVTGTIGGGYLENECIRLACAALRDGLALPARKLRRFALGSQCGQCCGGVVDVLFERVALADAAWLDTLVTLQQAGRHAVLVTPAVTGDDTTKWVVTADDSLDADVETMSAEHTLDAGFVTMTADESFDADIETINSDTHTRARLAKPDTANAGTGRARIDANARRAALAHLDSEQASGHAELRLTDGTKARFLLERIGPATLSIVLFGAGHVGRACAAVFGTLDAELLVVDSRAAYLEYDWPANTTAVFADQPAMLVEHCRPNSYYLIMTHDHAIDLTLCEAILTRDDRAFCGLIGSRSKQRRFDKKLRAAGIDEDTLATLTCPIGIDSIGGKQPGEIAIATAAQIVTHHQARLRARLRNETSVARGTSERSGASVVAAMAGGEPVDHPGDGPRVEPGGHSGGDPGHELINAGGQASTAGRRPRPDQHPGETPKSKAG